LLYQV